MAERAKRPLVSVLVPTFNRLAYLAEALRSAYAQTMRDFEVVVVDDGSIDGTWEWLRRQGFPRMTLLRNPRNCGAAASFNRGLARCRGRLIAPLESDDVWRSSYLARLAGAFDSPAVAIAFSEFDWIDERGRVLRPKVFENAPPFQPLFLILAGYRKIPTLSASVFRRAAFRKVGGFDENLRQIAYDSDLFLRMALRFGPAGFRFVRRSLVGYRRHGDAQQTTILPGLSPGDPVMTAMLRRWRSLDARQRDYLFDVLYKSHKYRWLVDLLGLDA